MLETHQGTKKSPAALVTSFPVWCCTLGCATSHDPQRLRGFEASNEKRDSKRELYEKRAFEKRIGGWISVLASCFESGTLGVRLLASPENLKSVMEIYLSATL